MLMITPPKGWFIRKAIDWDGTVRLSVMRSTETEDESGVLYPGEITDKVYEIRHERPWWQFWAGTFAQRLKKATEAAQKRAYTLSQRFRMAKGLTYEAEAEIARSRTNPHDE